MFGENYPGEPYPGQGYAGTTGSNATVNPPVLTLTLAAPAPTVSGTANATVSPPVMAVTLAFPAPTVSTGTNATVTPPVLTLTLAVLAPTVSATQNATITPPVLAVTLGLLAPVVSGGSSATITPPALALTFALLAPTVTGGTGGGATITPPVMGVTITLNAPTVLGWDTPATPGTIPDRPSFWLYGPRGQTLIGQLTLTQGGGWQQQLSKGGSGTLSVLETDPLAGSIADRAIIKCGLWGRIVHAFQVRSEKCQAAVDGLRLSVYETQPDLFATLNEAQVYPEYGLTRVSGADRWFGYMSAQLGWYVPAEWSHAQTSVWNAAGSVHGAYPAEFHTADPSAAWISPFNPEVTAPDWQVIYGRGSVEITTATNVEILFAADNSGELWHNGERIVPWQRMDFRSAQRVQLTLDRGSHLFAWKAQNHPQPAAYAGSPNPVAAIFTMYPVNKKGDKNGPVLLRSDSSWMVNDDTTEPGWHRGQILRVLFDEALGRSEIAARNLIRTFDEVNDSNGDPWSDEKISLSFPVRGIGLADVASQLAETGIDVWVDAATMTFNAANRKGSNKTATVQYKLGKDGGSLISYETTKTNSRFTAVAVQMADGTWQEITDTIGINTIGRIETGLSLGTSGTASATAVARQLLDENAADLITVTAEGATQVGPQIERDCDLGDTGTAPGHKGDGTMAVRFMSFTVVDGDVWRAYPDQMIEDKTA